MSRQITVLQGQVTLPDGKVYTTGDSVLITDEQWTEVDESLLGVFLRDDGDPDMLISAVEEDTTSRTLAIGDATKVVECTHVDATTVTIPPNADVAFPIGTVVSIYAAGAGGVTIAAGAGVTIQNLAALAQYEEANLRKRATNEWVQL